MTPAADPVAAARLIRGATVIDGTGAPPRPGTSLLIAGDRIAAIGADTDFGAQPDAEVLDARGLTVIPGLIDCHVHIGHSPEEMAPLYPRYGVTTVRDTGGNLEQLVALRDRLADGTLAGPRLFFCGPLFDTPPVVWDGITAAVETAEDVAAAMPAVAAAGAIAAKIYVGVRPPLVAAIVRIAREHGLPATGDLGATSATEAIAAGIAGLEHASSAYLDLVPPERQASMALFHEQGPAVWRREWNRGLADADGDGPAAQRLAALIAERDVAFDPTLVVLDCLGHLTESRVVDAPEVGLVPEQLRGEWQDRATGRRTHWTADDFATSHRAFATMRAFTSTAHHAGARMLVGSDAPNPFVVPGASLHRELELLVEAGLSPLEVLRLATQGNAAELRAQDDLGTLTPGKKADLVLLEADPLADIRSTRRIRLVIQNGAVVAGGEAA
ncbi:MAG TPA: amidohydrolase family protein [Thermomicrobiales bacterium]|jgi:imidazolonepropionase-like amidohydrolase